MNHRFLIFNKSIKLPLLIFSDIFGFSTNKNKPTDIRLLVDGIHIKYMKSLPLHHSQIIHSENENGQFFVDFHLITNYEFTTQILKIGNEVEVIYPPELRDEIKKRNQN